MLANNEWMIWLILNETIFFNRLVHGIKVIVGALSWIGSSEVYSAYSQYFSIMCFHRYASRYTFYLFSLKARDTFCFIFLNRRRRRRRIHESLIQFLIFNSIQMLHVLFDIRCNIFKFAWFVQPLWRWLWKFKNSF